MKARLFAWLVSMTVAVLFAGTVRGDIGDWRPLPLYGGGYMQDVVISPSEPNVWYCHADVCGPFRSDDAGRSWKPLHQNFPAAWRNSKVDHVRGVLVDPRNANRVLVAGGDNWNFMGGGIVVSDDGGQSWRMTLKGARFYGNGPRRMYGRVLSRDPFDPDRIVAGEDGDGLWLTRDNGETWRNLGLTNHWFTCVAFDTGTAGRIWATAFAFARPKPEFVRDVGFYRSDDFGATWTRLPCDPPPVEFTQLKKGGPILAIFENRFPRFSDDGGLTWRDAFEGLEILPQPPKNPWDRGNFYALGAGTDFYLLGDGAGRIWRRGAQEMSWTEHRMTFRAVGEPACERWVAERTRHQEAMAQFVVDPRDENHWLTTDWFAIWETTDAGKSFVSRVNGVSQVVPFCLAFDPNSAENIAYGLADLGLFVSNDGGRSYYPPIAKPGTPERRCEIVTACGNSLAYSTRTPGLLYVTGGKGAPVFRVSADAGRTWKAPAMRGLPSGMRNGGIAPYAVSVHPVTDDVWITMGGPVGRGRGGVYRSSDRGETWQWAGEGLPAGEKLFKNSEFGHGGGPEIFFSRDGSAAVAHARVAGKVFWFDATVGCWRSAEGLPANVRGTLVADGFTPGRFLVAGTPLRESTDGGRTWHVPAGLEKFAISSLAADAAAPGLFAAVGYAAIYVSRDGAKTFSLLPKAFETVPSSLGRTIYLDRGRLYFLTTGTGVWVREIQ